MDLLFGLCVVVPFAVAFAAVMPLSDGPREPARCMYDDPATIAIDGTCLRCGVREGEDCGDIS